MITRSIILGLACSMLASLVLGMEKPYRVTLIGDAFDGTRWQTGVLVEMQPGWKTYWRMPGEAGIPPEFSWQTSVPANIEVQFPAPGRHADASGETVGYADEVIFPVTVEAGNATDVTLKLSMFFAVCKDICIPAQAEAEIELGPAVRDAAGTARVEAYVKAVPFAGSAVTAARLDMENGRPVLVLSLAEPVEDIFIETATTAYFRAPQFSADGREARVAIDNAADPAKLQGSTVKLTYTRQGRGLEQSLTLP